MIRGRRKDPLRFWPEARRKSKWSQFYWLWGGAVVVGLAVGTSSQWVDKVPWPPAATTPQSLVADQGVHASFSFCHTGGGYNCVVDGDTIWLQGQNIRVADIDAPETHEYRCAEEKIRGDQATQRLLELVNGGSVTLVPIDRDEDRFGRKLRIVEVDGVSVGETLVNEGLARWYAGGKRPWC